MKQILEWIDGEFKITMINVLRTPMEKLGNIEKTDG